MVNDLSNFSERKSFGGRLIAGYISDVNVEENTCQVQTENGKDIDRVKIGGMGGGPNGTGLLSMPSPRTPCLVYESNGPLGEYVLVCTYNFFNNTDKKTQILKGSDLIPGMVVKYFEDGGHFKLLPSGLVDIKASPWAQRTYMPRRHKIKESVRQFEQITGPFDLFRRISSIDNENSFLELMLNDRFLYRSGDESPPIIWTLGDNTAGDTNQHNPNSPFRHYYEIDHRTPSSPENIARYVEERGYVDGVVSRETSEVVDQSSFVREIGVINNVLLQEYQTYENEERYHHVVTTDNERIVAIPGWVFAMEDAVARLTSRNEDAEMIMDGAKARLHNSSGSVVGVESGQAFVQGVQFSQLSDTSTAITAAQGTAGASVPFAMPSMVLGVPGPPPVSKSESINEDYEGIDEFGGSDEDASENSSQSSVTDYYKDVALGQETRSGNGRVSIFMDDDTISLEARHPDLEMGGVDRSYSPNSYGVVSSSGSMAKVSHSDGGSFKAEGQKALINEGGEPLVKGDSLSSVLNQMLTIMEGMAGAISAGAGSPYIAPINAVKSQLQTIKSQHAETS